MLKGTIYKSTGKWYEILCEDGNFYKGRIRGKWRLKGIRTTNPIAVGDHVICKKEEGQEGNVIITELIPRDNYIIRKSNKLSSSSQILAANIDQLVLLASVVSPVTSRGFMDRVLMTAEAYHIKTKIIYNKIDLLTPEQIKAVENIKTIYEKLGYKGHLCCINTDADVKKVMPIFKNKTTLLNGHSGVGKSTLLNALMPNNIQKTNTVSVRHQMGKHTTTFAEMFKIADNSYVIDTPGIRDFGIFNFEQIEVGHYFPEIKERLNNCKYNNCLHILEPDCAIKKAVETKEIDYHRYESYISILNNDDVFS